MKTLTKLFSIIPFVQFTLCFLNYRHQINYKSSLTMINEKKRVVVFGPSGYIGKYVLKESISRGYDTVAFVRDGSNLKPQFSEGATIVRGDVTSEDSVRKAFEKKTDVAICCLASRSGTKSDSFLIDYQASLNTLNAARASGVKHFILLSAFCVRKPLLSFQDAKLMLEDALIKSNDIKYSIIRPTAFFKSVSGQVELVKNGKPFVVFGDGSMCKCNPIAETDLAEYMINSIDDETKWNKILNIGGPDEGMTMEQQGELIFDIVKKKPNIWKLPVGIFDTIIGIFAFFGKWFPSAEDAAELGRIGKYYAVEDMLTTNPTEKYGKVTLRQHYERIVVEGQEYDPYTSMFGKLP